LGDLGVLDLPWSLAVGENEKCVLKTRDIPTLTSQLEALRPAAGGQERRRSKDLPEKVAPATRFAQTLRNSATFRAVCFASPKTSGSSFFAFPM